MRLFLPGPSLARAGWRSQTATIQSLIKKRNISDDALKQRVQIYRSMCDDPYVNLSIEHHLMKRSDEESTILFLYVNRPSIVIGRNQNPWKEINFVEQRRGVGVVGAQNKAQPIYLVRRRSGGGTVFHDRGNVNWCVICPPRHFDRDLHAKMVARALGKIGCEGVRVNERHDIVQDVQEEDALKTYKVSGSAYKLTRTRSLHHGTCLLHSIDSSKISQLLKSPADGYIKAAGVDSVRSPVRNLMKERREFSDAVQNEFRLMYAGFQADFMLVHEHDAMAIEPLRKGVEELKSAQWFWGQTPQFTVSFKPTLEDPRERPRNELSKLISPDVARYLDIKITVRHGIIIGITMRGLDWAEDIKEDMSNVLADTFVETPIYQLDFLPKLAKLCRNNPRSYKKLVQVTDWLHAVFGSRPSPLRAHFLHPSKVVEEDEKELTAAETETAKLKGDEVEFEPQHPRELDPWADRIAKLLKKPAEAQHKAP